MPQSDLHALARSIRAHSLRMVHSAQASHAGSCLSVADILAALYGGALRHDPQRPDWPDRDRLVVSKGHAAAAVFAALAEVGFFSVEKLSSYYQDGSDLHGHLTYGKVPGVELSTGSLGHGLPVATGMALAAQKGGKDHRVFAVLSDGECDEGSTWEAALFAGHHGLTPLCAIVDYNHQQALGRTESVLNLDPLADKWTAFGWAVREIDGNDVDLVAQTLAALPFDPARPSCVVAHTVKGKGVSYMEDDLLWHYRWPREEDLRRALDELGVAP